MTDKDREQKKLEIAYEILMLSKNNLLVDLRFMDKALDQFIYVPGSTDTVATDGSCFFYDPSYILAAYMEGKENIVRDNLHIVMHCVFRHMYGITGVNRRLWDLACDIAVEHIITNLDLSSAALKRDAEENYFFDELKNKINIITAEKVYNYFTVTDLSDAKIDKLMSVFCRDNHDIWYNVTGDSYYPFQNEKKQNDGDRENANRPSSDGNSGENDDRQDADCGDSGNNGRQDTDGDDGGNNGRQDTDGDDGGNDDRQDSDGNSSKNTREYLPRANDRETKEQIWKNISKRMQIDLETFSKRIGDKANSLIVNLNAVNREKYDYTSFLKKFAVLGEAMKINDDEFDYIFYTYGLKLYEKMPLIEPLEYKEIKRIREFVIAIDTSGSVAGEKVQAFMQKTYNILKSTESFFSKINLHIIQCDAEIQDHVKITNQDEFDEWLKNAQLRGFGGTDFRPVFDKVNELIKCGEFTSLKGLIYFTDGYGTFPEVKPNYKTAFLFVNDNYTIPEVPSWAIKLVLQTDEL